MSHFLDIAADLVREHEGLRLKPYRDTTGHLTVGYGRNLDAVGISAAEAETMLANDLDRATEAAIRWLGEEAWRGLDDIRRAVVVDMAFNMGLGTLRQFTATRTAIVGGMWDVAAERMLDSKWSRQVGGRARRLAEMMLTGEPAGVAARVEDADG